MTFQDIMLKTETTQNQETVHFLDTQYRDVSVNHFLSPWLQET